MSATQADLFATPLLSGFSYAQGIVDASEERALIERIDAAGLAPFRFQGWVGKRLTVSYGWQYDFDTARFTRAEPLPDWLLPLRERAARFAGLDPAELVHALLIRYDPGAGIGWHRDRPVFEHVVGISLAAAATLRLRRRTAAGFERRAAPLAPRSAYHLSGEARHRWSTASRRLRQPAGRSRSAAFPKRESASARCEWGGADDPASLPA